MLGVSLPHAANDLTFYYGAPIDVCGFDKNKTACIYAEQAVQAGCCQSKPTAQTSSISSAAVLLQRCQGFRRVEGFPGRG